MMQKKVGLFAVAAGALGIAVAHGGGADYTVPKAWEPVPIMGRTFYSLVGVGSVPLMTAHPEFPMYDHPWLEIQGPFYQNDLIGIKTPTPPEKAFTNRPVRITEVLAQKTAWPSRLKALEFFEKRYPNHPFTISFWGARPIYQMQDAPFETDRDDFARWRRDHPGFFSFCAFDEYDSDVGGYLWKIIEEVKDPALKARYARQYPGEGTDRLRLWSVHDFRKSMSYHFGSDRLYGLWSNWPSVGHLLARQGLTLLWYEAEHGSMASPWRWGGMFSRGAARQFHTTFGWYCASFTYNTARRDGKELGDLTSTGIPKWPNPSSAKWLKDHPEEMHLGGSRSLMARNLWYGYFIGSVLHCMEGSSNFFYATDKDGGWTLSPYGEDYNAIFAWHRDHDRGVVYTPVALLTSVDELFSRCHYYDYGSFAKKDPAAPAAFAFTLVPAYVGDEPRAEYVFADKGRGFEGCLWNSPFGEIADVLCPDAGQAGDTFLDVLSGYKAAFLVGEHNPKTCDVRALDAYVRGGGTLFCSWDQVRDGLVSSEAAGVTFGGNTVPGGNELRKADGASLAKLEDGYAFAVGTPGASARPYLTDEKGNVVAWRSTCGKGRVVTVTATRMLPADLYPLSIVPGVRNPMDGSWAHNPKAYPAIARGTRRFPIIERLLKAAQDALMPVTVEGDIQWGVNKVEVKGRGRGDEGDSAVNLNLQPQPSHWLVWLMNNRGVTKFAQEPEVLDPKATSRVKVTLKSTGKTCEIDVPAGQVRTIEL